MTKDERFPLVLFVGFMLLVVIMLTMTTTDGHVGCGCACAKREEQQCCSPGAR